VVGESRYGFPIRVDPAAILTLTRCRRRDRGGCRATPTGARSLQPDNPPPRHDRGERDGGAPWRDLVISNQVLAVD